ncbi:lysis protein [Salmonella enterica]|uniref:Lysis protein n=1 Tax=Salmonella enterica subsp. enterica serovar Poona TaxID=436295 RepID=A0A5V6N933_SALET|nr:lysis protein [Salmonella enterica subsp. enterica serovar Oranienburg]EAA7484596.1 lysis protein [Salmonella enterica subsp. enterica serovar Irumu]EAP9255067.1 lysis protein [Salmonella enterica]EBS4764045.1 lysis protein [Salmonella enterica subsp. enterica serovar Poona]ECI0429273.1 lysis protein [Salmonella enterica subsp. enterica serovar Soumbedioune]EDL3544128.1 lysis protein [Salmonella enterica subsp. enterica serovar Newport]EGR8150091.1 lysis protein [Salmonella enterica subsp.
MNRVTTGVITSLLIVAAALAWTARHYHGNAVEYKDQRDTATHNLNLANETISDMTRRQRQNAALDAKYTQELANAKAESEKLRADLAAGRRRLQLHATCMPAPARDTAATGATDAAAARLTPDAERDYQRLRTEAGVVIAQVNGLQQYINEQCHQPERKK